MAAWEDIFTPNEPMLALVEQLHGRFPLFLLSNTSDIHREYVFRRYPVFQRFTSGTYSYEAKASKPGHTIYEIAQRQLGLEPASTFFIDDLLPNIETAPRAGVPDAPLSLRSARSPARAARGGWGQLPFRHFSAAE